MAEWGGTGTKALKNAINDIFCEKGRIPLQLYHKMLVSIPVTKQVLTLA